MRKFKVVFLHWNTGMLPLGQAYLMGQMDEKKYEKFFLTFGLDKNGEPEIPSDLYSIKPEICCSSVLSGFERIFLCLNSKIKEYFPDTLSIFGGPHITFNEDFINHRSVDVICRGDGDECFPRFLDEYAGGQAISRINVVGMSTKYHKTKAVLVDDLDAINFPDRIKIYQQIPRLKQVTYLSMIAGRGCPFNCSYCFNSVNHEIFKGMKFVRSRRVESVIEEIREMRKIKYFIVVRFMDDAFPLEKEWLEEFSQLRAKFVPDIYFTANFRVELLDSARVVLLKKAGCIGAVCAVESSNEDIRARILNRHMTNEKITTIFQGFRQNGIKVMSQNMVGIPGSSIVDDYNTLAFNKRLQPDFT